MKQRHAIQQGSLLDMPSTERKECMPSQPEIEKKMSRLEELIAELCPDGVEYKQLSEILTIKNGKDYKEFNSGNIPVYGSGGIIAYIDTFVYDKPSVLLPRKGSIDKIYYVDCPFWTVDTIFYTKINRNIVLEKYVFYAIQVQHIEKLNTGGGVPSLTQSILNKILIPIPPLPIQEEIVRILDKFTELTAELTAELTKRKQQYQYYRDIILSGVSKVTKQKLGEVCAFKYGKGNTIPKEDGIYPVYGSNGIVGKTNEYNNQDAPIIGHIGSAGIVNWGYGKHFVTYNGTMCIPNNKKIISKYSYYLLQSLYLDRRIKGNQPYLSVSDFIDIDVSIPPLEEQKRIVSILDRFDALCNDLTSGLPAEIAARKKQYEYYRDKLLSFPEKPSVRS